MIVQRYALLKDGEFTGRIETFNDAPPQLAPEKGMVWVECVDQPAPEFDPMTRLAERSAPAMNESGQLVRGWTVRPLTLDEIRTKRQPLIEEASSILDRHRNQVEGGIYPTSITSEKAQEWRVYMQALRDITMQVESSLVWPGKP